MRLRILSNIWGLQKDFPVLIADSEERESLNIVYIHTSQSFMAVNSPLNIVTSSGKRQEYSISNADI